MDANFFFFKYISQKSHISTRRQLDFMTQEGFLFFISCNDLDEWSVESEMTWKDGVVCKRTSYNGSLGDCGGSNQMGTRDNGGVDTEGTEWVGVGVEGR